MTTRRHLTTEESAAFVAAAMDEDLPVRTLCLTVALTGCRISEALEVTWQQFDVLGGHLTFRSLQQRRSDQFRLLWIPPVLRDALSRLRLEAGASPADPIWPWQRVTAWRRVKEVLGKADIQGSQASPQGLRTSFAMAAVQCGAPDAIVHRWLGNAYPGFSFGSPEVPPEQERKWLESIWRNILPPAPDPAPNKAPDDQHRPRLAVMTPASRGAR